MAKGVMERPDGCPDRLYRLMGQCWSFVPRHRPTFLEIIEDLLPDVPAQFAGVSFYHSDAGIVARSTQRPHTSMVDSRLIASASYHPASALDYSHRPHDDDGDDDGDGDLEGNSLLDENRLVYASDDQVVQIDDIDDGDEVGGDDDDDDDDHGEHVSGAVLNDGERNDDDEREAANEEDHVSVSLNFAERKAYILVRNPGNNVVSNGSKTSDSSRGTTAPSEGSKGSYVSNGSAAANGFMRSVLKQRSAQNADY